MPRDFLRFISRPADLLKALKNVTVGGAVAALGISTAGAAPASPTASANPAPAALSPKIVDRSRKKPALLLQLPATAFTVSPQHRSHRSHSSHRSSSGGGSTAAPLVTPPPARKAAPEPAPAAGTRPLPALADSVDGALSSAESGVIEAIDTARRVITIRSSSGGTARYFAYRDDTRLRTVTGSSIRFDEYSEMSAGQIPVAKNDKVQFTWRASQDGKTLILQALQKTP